MGHIFKDDDPPVFARTDKVVVIGTEAIVSTQGENADLVEDTLVKNAVEVFIQLVKFQLISCFFKRGQDGFTSIDRDISDFPVIVLTDILETAENTASA